MFRNLCRGHGLGVVSVQSAIIPRQTARSAPRLALFSSMGPCSQKQARQEIAEEEPVEEEEYVAPDMENIENRWEKLKQEDQYDIIDHLKDKQELSWRTDLTEQEKKLAYYLLYGNWGAREKAPLSLPEFVFRLMSSSLLFLVLGFSLVNHLHDKEKILELEEKLEKEKE